MLCAQASARMSAAAKAERWAQSPASTTAATTTTTTTTTTNKAEATPSAAELGMLIAALIELEPALA